MKHSINVNGNHALVSLTGEMYLEEAAEIRLKILDLIEKGVSNINFDLSGTTYIDSSGLGVLVTIHKRTLQKNGKLILNGVQGMVKELLELTCMDRVFIIE